MRLLLGLLIFFMVIMMCLHMNNMIIRCTTILTIPRVAATVDMIVVLAHKIGHLAVI